MLLRVFMGFSIRKLLHYQQNDYFPVELDQQLFIPNQEKESDFAIFLVFDIKNKKAILSNLMEKWI